MRSFEFEHWDAGRLTVNGRFANLLRSHGLTTFETIWGDLAGETTKNVLPERTTVRFELSVPLSPSPEKPPMASAAFQEERGLGAKRCFYIKRHDAPPWAEYVKPWLRLTRPILGARNEWEAILQFHGLGIPTMTPVALGESGRRSFLITEAIPHCTKLSLWMEQHVAGSQAPVGNAANRLAAGPAAKRETGPGNPTEPVNGRLREVVEEIAGISRAMHRAGVHHQDFYLTHLLLPNDYPQRPLHVIDLGRARYRRKLSRRWIVKDLAQLIYSAHMLSKGGQRHFLESYLGRPLRPTDRPFLRRIERKTDAIARHSKKNRL